jgi:hypothetical protein
MPAASSQMQSKDTNRLWYPYLHGIKIPPILVYGASFPILEMEAEVHSKLDRVAFLC